MKTRYLWGQKAVKCGKRKQHFQRQRKRNKFKMRGKYNE